MNRALCGLFAATTLLALPAQATVFNATSSTLTSIFAKAKAGDTIKLSGSFGGTSLANRSFTKALTIDATQATFTGTLAITKVKNVNFIGGNYGSSTSLLNQAVRVNQSSLVSFLNPNVVGNGTNGHGIAFNGSSKITVDGGVFTRLRAGVIMSGVTGAVIKNNQSLQAASDGFDIANSHQVKVTNNTCANTQATPGSHPDCVQLWSISGQPRQSDIMIADNIATGSTQGFTSFDAAAGGGLRISMLRNQVDTSWSQGIACHSCDYSTFIGNVLTTQPGAQFQTTMNILWGSHNTISGNSVGPFNGRPGSQNLTSGLAARGDFAAAIDEPFFESYADVFTDMDPNLTAVPEPGIWAMLIAGFGMAGAALRRRRTAAFA